MGKIIQFPGTNKRISLSQEEIVDSIDNMKHYHVHETVQNMMPIIINSMNAAGFDFDIDEETLQPHNIKDGALLVESLRSILLKHYGLDHPLQILSENLFEIEEEGLLSLNGDVLSNLITDGVS